MLLPLHRRCILGNKDEDCSRFAMRQMMEVLARKIMNLYSDITTPPEIEDVERTVIQSVDEINENKYSNIWSTPTCYPPLKLFPREVVHLLCSIDKD